MSGLRRLLNQFKKGSLSKASYIRKMHDIHRILWDYSDFIQDKNISFIKISKDQVSFTTQNGIGIICDLDDQRATPIEILNFYDYESDQLRMMRKFLNPRSIILDIGANIGWYSLNLSKYVPAGRIIAFEPIAKTFELLKKNIRLNGVTNVELRNIGLSDKKGTFEFYYNPRLTGAASLRDLGIGAGKKKIRCKVKRLDDIADTLPSRIDFIKCDVEGAELFVIRGALDILKKTKPVLFLEMLRKWSAKFGYHPNDMIDLLKTVDYGCYLVKSNRLFRISKVTNKTKETNFYFLNNKKHARFIKHAHII